MAHDTAVPDAPTSALLRTLITSLEDKKAERLTVLHVGGVSDITDYLVLATGNSEPHLRALRIEAEKVLDAAKARIAGMDSGGFNSGWTVVDAYQIMIHFFTAEQRENYALEKLWKDAPEVDLKTLAAKPVAPAKAAKDKAVKSKSKTKTKAPAAKAKASAKKKAPAKKAAAGKSPKAATATTAGKVESKRKTPAKVKPAAKAAANVKKKA
jgi:ribosome-associated protein